MLVGTLYKPLPLLEDPRTVRPQQVNMGTPYRYDKYAGKFVSGNTGKQVDPITGYYMFGKTNLAKRAWKDGVEIYTGRRICPMQNKYKFQMKKGQLCV